MCDAKHVKPPCNPFKILPFDLDKWRPRSVMPSQINPHYECTAAKGGCTLRPHPKLAAVGVLGRQGRQTLWALYPYSKVESTVNPTPDYHLHNLAAALQEMASEYDLPEVEFRVTSKEVPMTGRKNRSCTARGFGVHHLSSPDSCDMALPTGLRYQYTNVSGAFGSTQQCVHLPSQCSRPYGATPTERKRNMAFWTGALWPITRCKTPPEKSTRFLLAVASTLHPRVLNASFGNFNANDKQTMKAFAALKATATRKLDRLRFSHTPFAEHDRYRFLLSASPPCTYTGRVGDILLSNSVLMKFSRDQQAAETLYGGLQAGLHYIPLTKQNFLNEIRAAQNEESSSGNARSRQLVANANRYARWALSRRTIKCYLLRLLDGMASKLAYAPERDGFFRTVLALVEANPSGYRSKEVAPRLFEGRSDAHAIELWLPWKMKSAAKRQRVQFRLEHVPLDAWKRGPQPAKNAECAHHEDGMPTPHATPAVLSGLAQ